MKHAVVVMAAQEATAGDTRLESQDIVGLRASFCCWEAWLQETRPKSAASGARNVQEIRKALLTLIAGLLQICKKLKG